mgnify:CR=1 FL=1
MTRGSQLSLIAAVIAIIICLAFIVVGFGALPEVEMGIHGWVALALGIGFSVVIGGGLAAILIISRRRGFDEAAHDAYRQTEELD